MTLTLVYPMLFIHYVEFLLLEWNLCPWTTGVLLLLGNLTDSHNLKYSSANCISISTTNIAADSLINNVL